MTDPDLLADDRAKEKYSEWRSVQKTRQETTQSIALGTLFTFILLMAYGMITYSV